MPRQTPSPAAEWLTLQEASQRLGVSAATLRNWANEGKLATSRTPGGHRRFSAGDVSALMGAKPGAPDPARARMDARKDQLEDMPWYRPTCVKTKTFYRKLGGRLMTLLVRVLRGEENERDLRREAEELGHQLGQASLAEGVPLTDTLRLFLFFRDYVLEDAIAMIPTAPDADQNAVKRYHRASGFFNEVLLEMVSEFLNAEV